MPPPIRDILTKSISESIERMPMREFGKPHEESTEPYALKIDKALLARNPSVVADGRAVTIALTGDFKASPPVINTVEFDTAPKRKKNFDFKGDPEQFTVLQLARVALNLRLVAQTAPSDN